MTTLSLISKKIIQSRLYDKGISIQLSDLDNYIIDNNRFTDFNEMFDFIIDNFKTLVIE